MGREIRMVPPNFEHPQKEVWNNRNQLEKRFKPMFDETYKSACEEWKKEFLEFYESKENEEHDCEFWDWNGGPPDKEYYRTYEDSEATWFCAYETVSEGTPVTPPFATQEELAQYLAVNGDFWDQQRRREGDSIMPCAPWGIEAARKFVFGSGYMPSMIVTNGRILSGGDLAAEMGGKSGK